MHQPVRPWFIPRVAPVHVAQGRIPRDGASSYPDSLILRTPPALDWGHPRLALPIAPSDAAASRPAHHIFGFCRRWSFELPRIPHPISAPGGFWIPGFPAILFRPLRLAMHPWSRPQFLHLPALPAIELRVAPKSVSFSPTGASTAGMPRGCALPAVPPDAFPGCPVPASSGCAGDGSSSYPESLVLRRLRCLGSRFPGELRRFRLRLPMRLRVAPRASSSGLASGLSLRVAPAPLSSGSG
jgi:hypothetical protein